MPILETLPGWPAADEPSIFLILLVLVFIPLAIAAVFTVIGMGGKWRREDPVEAERLAYQPDDAPRGGHAVQTAPARAALDDGRGDANPSLGDEVADLREEQLAEPSSAREA